ncbi:MAG: hypothetical protein ACMXX5_01010 [Candidatus Woesearchaeota archaeon]
MLKKRVDAKTVESIFLFLISCLGIVVIIILAGAFQMKMLSTFIMIVVLLILVILIILGLTYLLIRIWGEHIIPEEGHKIEIKKTKKKSPAKKRKK